MNWDGRQSVFDYLGNHMSEKEAAENTETVWTIIEQAMKYSNEESATIPADKSLYSFFEELVQKLIPTDGAGAEEEEAKRKRETVLHMAEMWGAFVGSPIQKQSLKFFWLEECIDGENLFVAETYHKVLQKIAEPALSKATLKLGHKVQRITSHFKNEDTRVTIDVEGKESQNFNEVVMTAPLGWLKRNVDAFVPELPKRLKDGIEAIGYGHLDKVRRSCSAYLHMLTAQLRSTLPFQPLSGTSHLHPTPHQAQHATKAYPTSQPRPHLSINHPRRKRLKTQLSVQTTTQASRTGLDPPTPPIRTLKIGIKKPSTLPLCQATQHIQPCSSTLSAQRRCISRNFSPARLHLNTMNCCHLSSTPTSPDSQTSHHQTQIMCQKPS
jgi:hypothetical protein